MAKTSPTSDAERHNQNVIRLVLLQISNFGKPVKKIGTISEFSLLPIWRCAKFNHKSIANRNYFQICT